MVRWWQAALLGTLSGCGTMRSVPALPPAIAPAAPADPSLAAACDASASDRTDEQTIAVRGAPCTLRTTRVVSRLKAILADEGLPPEMVAVPIVESGLRPHLRGRHGERGIWQIRPATARRIGLRVGAARDDRLDLERSTRAAARYLAALHVRYGSWPLALAAYNAGEGRVDRALARHRHAAFSELAERRALPAHSRAYVPKVLAMMKLVATPDACRARVADGRAATR
jgi:membrane-bound lytic murein transglycosylase D